MHLRKRLEPHAGGFIVRISAREAQEIGLVAGDALDVQLLPALDREEVMKR